MKHDKNNGEVYAKIIIEDDLNRIAWEETLTHEENYIEREYEIDDGAFIKYEWRSFPGNSPEDAYNHKFTLITPPKKNPDKLKPGVLLIIPHSPNSR